MKMNYYNNGYLPFPKGFTTAAIHVAQDPEEWSLSVVPPLFLSSTFKHPAPGKPKQYNYGRLGNPSRNVLEQVLAALEGSKYGVCFSSGMGAIATLLSILEPGDNVICSDDIYGGTYNLLKEVKAPQNVTTTFVDLTSISNLQNAIKPNTKLIWIETPTNPTLKVLHIEAISEIAKKHGVLLAVDNTFLTPYLQRPLTLGADFVVYSLTKYMNGHSDVIMGAVLLNNEELHDKLRLLQIAMGCIPAPFDCYQVNRSLKTLAIRMERHSSNSLKVAQFLEDHPKVIKVLHPGLPSHPQHEIFKKQTSGYSGMVSFYIRGGLEGAKGFLGNLKIFTLANSLGGYESLAELPSLMTHAPVPEEERKALHITNNLIRLSVGLEDPEDLIADLKQALEDTPVVASPLRRG